MSRESAIHLGLGALYDVADKAGEGPIRPSLGLRALLAFLYFHSNGDKAPFVDFWRECQNAWDGQSQPGYMRSTYCRRELQRVIGAMGVANDKAWDEFIRFKRPQDRDRSTKGDCGWL
jgi:hypothetical protein